MRTANYGEEAKLKYTQNEVGKVLELEKRNIKSIADAFEQLTKEVKALEVADQIMFNSQITQLLQRIQEDKGSSSIALEIFKDNFHVHLYGKNPSLKTVGLSLAVVGVSFAILLSGIALGMGIGMLAGLWVAPMAFLAAVVACESGALLVAGISGVAALGFGAYVAYSFFKESSLEKALRMSVDAVQLSFLTKQGVGRQRFLAKNEPEIEADVRESREDLEIEEDGEGEDRSSGFGL